MNDNTRQCVPTPVATRVVFSINSELFTWADVVCAAEARGSWQTLLACVSDGVAAYAKVLSKGGGPTDDELDAAMVKFRYDRNLIAADDLLGWLANWSVSVEDLEMFLRRTLAREHLSNYADGIQKATIADHATIAAATWPEASCSGFIERAGQQLSADVALAVRSGLAAGGRTLKDFQVIQATADTLRSGALNSESLERELVCHRLEWTSLRALRLELFDEDMAKEVAMCVRSDGNSLAETARECGVTASEINVLMTDIDEELLSYALASREGELIGPLRLKNKWILLAIEQKAPPSLNDPLVRQRARELIVRRIEQQAISQCVKWHVPPGR